MRIDSIASILFLLTGLAATPAISQDAAPSASHNSHPVITTITVADRADGVAVEVVFSKFVQAEVSALEHPGRLVFDFPGCELAHPGQRLTVNRGSVVAVRAAEFSVTPPIARVVIDLKSALDHEETYVGNKLVIKLNSKLNSAGRARPSAPASGENVAANSPPLAPKSDRAAPKPSDSALPEATMFEAGQGGPVDTAAAAKYYELAANYGLARAQYRLGLLLASDRSNATSLVSAYKWLVLAQDLEKESAATAQELRKLLTPLQLAQAEHEIDEWRTAHLPRQPSR